MNRKIMITLSFILLATLSCKNDQQKAKAEVEAAVELFRKTLVVPNYSVFDSLLSESLSYGHSNGLVEDKKTCIESMVTGKFKFLSLELTDQTIVIEDNTAIVRHTFFARTDDEGKEPGTAHLKNLQVWHKEGGKWRLLTRQSTKILSN